MPRVSKDPVERKNELIAVAEKLFLEKGYENTSVSDIAKTIGIAQGTFYYHFKSKADILEAVADKLISGLEYQIGKFISPLQEHEHVGKRINDMINVLFKIKRSGEKFLEYLHKDSNLSLHNKLFQRAVNRIIPLFAKIIREGVRKKELNVDYPDETAEILASTVSYVWHLKDLDQQRYERIRKATEQTLARSVGLESHWFQLDLR